MGFHPRRSHTKRRGGTLWLLVLLLAPPPVGAAEEGDPKALVAEAKITPWRAIFQGVEMCEGSTDTPRPLQVRALRVDLHEPTIEFLVTPSNGDEELDTVARTTSEFLEEFKCQVAINGSPFRPMAGRSGEPQDVLGLSLSRGDRYSPPDNNYDALLIDRDRKAWIARKPFKNKEKAYHGLSGFYALLIDGKNVGTMKDRHPRSAVGVSRNGRYLILMTIDGRQEGYSEGTSTAETAEWIRKLGAHDGLNLDGGGSTTLVIAGPDGQPRVLNRPSGHFERRVANHLGVFARPLDDSSQSKPAKESN